MALYELDDPGTLDDPVLVVAFDGWVNAGSAGTLAAQTVAAGGEVIATVDPDAKQVYLTEDEPDGRLYRFTPRRYPDLANGTLEVAQVNGDPTAGADVTWITVSEGTKGATAPMVARPCKRDCR